MKKQGWMGGLVVVLACVLTAQVAGQELGAFRPPAVPLATVDPYMSVWSFSDTLYDSWPQHWTGTVQAMAGMIRVDGRAYRFMGPATVCAEAARQTGLEVYPTQTIYTFAAGPVELKVNFTTPMLPDELGLMASPVTYVRFAVRSMDNKTHNVSLYFDATGEWVVDKPEQKVTWRRMPQAVAGFEFVQMGSAQQPILEKSGDNLRIDWGHLYVGRQQLTGDRSVVGFADDCREAFVASGNIPEKDDTDMPRAANQRWPVIASVMTLPSVGEATVERIIVLSYDDFYSAEFMQQKLRPWWFKVYGSFRAMLEHALHEYPVIFKRCDAFDKELLTDARALGGEAYARLIALGYRHTLASGKIVVSPDGSAPWFMHKECFSNGCMTTVDVSYPACPFFALFSPALLNGMAAPVFEYAMTDDWTFEFAPHDIGTYPKGNGQAYGRDRRTNTLRLEGQMPVEECGNMILMTAAAARADGDMTLVKNYRGLLRQWAEYLKEKGLDPENQLCTDDFTGHLAHNTNLSLKAINALGAYGMLCEMLGDAGEAASYRQAAKQMAAQWETMAADGDHYRLTFDKPQTWSMKYNLVWDDLLGLGLFKPEVAQKEVAYYLKIQNAYGLPLDNRADFTKSDWLVWCATMAESKADFEKLIMPLYRFVNESPDRMPFSDWYFTSTAKVRGFRARPVIGGIFIRFLDDEKLWKKWVARADKP
ncbi:MAG: DUF4965 domain-containing protein [Phycisphaerae bacterium]|nr:DUF4965 domain-containing protein [Phycisphaerae bacterium]